MYFADDENLNENSIDLSIGSKSVKTHETFYFLLLQLLNMKCVLLSIRLLTIFIFFFNICGRKVALIQIFKSRNYM